MKDTRDEGKKYIREEGSKENRLKEGRKEREKC